MISALKSVYPNQDWKEWKFKKVSQGYWNHYTHQREYLNDLSDTLQLTTPSDWYQLSSENTAIIPFLYVQNQYANYNGSLYRVLSTLYPEYEWQPTFFRDCIYNTKHWSQQLHNQYDLVEWIAQQLNISSMEGWYSIDRRQLSSLAVPSTSSATTSLSNIPSVSYLLNRLYNGSIINLLQTLYPEYHWKVWKFTNLFNPGHWREKPNRKEFFNAVAKYYGLQQFPQDWYSLQRSDIIQQGGKELLDEHYQGSLLNALRDIYPEYEWNISAFASRIGNEQYWTNDIQHLKDYLQEIGKEIQIWKLEDWYRVKMDRLPSSTVVPSMQRVLEICGMESIESLLRYVFPDHNWKGWMFRDNQESIRYWSRLDNQIRFIHDLEEVRLLFDLRYEIILYSYIY